MVKGETGTLSLDVRSSVDKGVSSLLLPFYQAAGFIYSYFILFPDLVLFILSDSFYLSYKWIDIMD